MGWAAVILASLHCLLAFFGFVSFITEHGMPVNSTVFLVVLGTRAHLRICGNYHYSS